MEYDDIEYVQNCYLRLINNQKLLTKLEEEGIELEQIKLFQIGVSKADRNIFTAPVFDPENQIQEILKLPITELKQFIAVNGEITDLVILNTNRLDWVTHLSKIVAVEEIEDIPEPLLLHEFLEQKFPGFLQYWGNGILHHGSLVFLFAPPKVGKSIFVLNWAISLAYGKEFLGIPILNNAIVLYLDSEIGRYYLHERLSIMTNNRNYKECTKGKLIPVSLFGYKIDNLSDQKVFELFFEQTQAKVVIFDTFSNYTENAENSNEGMKAPFAILKKWTAKYGISFIMVHHSKKAKSGSIVNDLRGPSAIAACATSIIRITKNGNQQVIEMELRNARPMDNIWTEIDENMWYQLVPPQDQADLQLELVVSLLKDRKEPIAQADLLAMLVEKSEIKSETWRKKLAEYKKQGLIKGVKSGKTCMFEPITEDNLTEFDYDIDEVSDDDEL